MLQPDHELDGFSRRRQIIDEATTLFLQRGYAGTSMSQLAKACGMQKASLYHHFPTKEALFVACATDGFDEAIAELAAIRADPTLDDDERFRRAIHAVYRINIDSACGRMAPLIAEVSRTIPAVARAFHDEFIMHQHVLMNGIIDDGIARGSFQAPERLGFEHMIFGPVVSLSLEREMFTTFDKFDTLRPIERIRTEHAELLLRLLHGADGGARGTAGRGRAGRAR
ncbi:MAG: TetR/AcrR family transcriptional regulator [Gemmatimonadaceae bacterium]|jgi:AcrR family transcriptional regulator|nr:TetR/AcrR family transcriptional regulator [Gemmatimonadaceae bacterium]